MLIKARRGDSCQASFDWFFESIVTRSLRRILFATLPAHSAVPAAEDFSAMIFSRERGAGRILKRLT
jgi:hypothetical protein